MPTANSIQNHGAEMQIRRITEGVAVGAQMEPSDVAEIAAAGYKSVICNRPDGEGPGQPPFDGIAREAERLGLQFRYLPVVSGQVTEANAADFGKAVDELPGPVFAFCRTGTRCAALWSLDQGSRGEPVNAIVEAAREAGYDMAPLAARIAANGGK
jgi:sulfide:quinone oxidoreductase